MSGETVGAMPVPEAEPNPERSSYIRKDGFQARLILGIDALDPAREDLGNITLVENAQVSAGVDDRIQQRSWKERQDTASNTTVDTWATNMVAAMTKSQGFFNNESGKGPKYVEAIQKVTGLNIKTLDVGQAKDIYNEFGKKPEDFKKFIEKVDQKLGNPISAVELEALEWFGKIFGANTGEIISQRVDLQKRINNAAEKQAFADTANAQEESKSRLNRLTEKEKKLLTFLWNNESAAAQPTNTEPTPTPPVDGEPAAPTDPDATVAPTDTAPDATTEPTPEAPALSSVATMLEALKKPLNADNPIIKEYFVENPPKGMAPLTDQEKSDVVRATQLPFFVKAKGLLSGIRGLRTNDAVIPYVYLLQLPPKDRSDELKQVYPGPLDPRFLEATQLTDDDSSVLALASVSAPDAEKEAYMYRDMADVIVQVFESKPTLFKDWLAAQTQDGSQSAKNFLKHDEARKKKGQGDKYLLLKPAEENGVLDANKFNDLWQARLAELKTALDSGNLEDYHHRWIEMMSKAVDMKKVNELIRSKSTLPTTPTAATAAT